jgi:carboxypeptidase family protein/ankyrin repeat protein
MSNNFRDHIKIESPCDADWDSMVGNDRARFCKHCNLNVNDIDNFTSKELRRLLLTSRGRICFRYREPAVILPRLHQIVPRRVARFAAGAFSAALSLSAAAVQQANASSLSDSPSYVFRTVVQRNSSFSSGSLTGTITSDKGLPIDGAMVMLSNAEKNLVFSVSTDAKGTFTFEFMESGYYQFSVQAPGFEALRSEQLFVSEGTTKVDRNLVAAAANVNETTETQVEISSERVVMGGGMVMLPSEPLVKAAQANDINKVRELLLTGVSVNVRDKTTDLTALDYAAQNGNRELLKFLIGEGADVNGVGEKHRTPLMELGTQSLSDMVGDLVTAGAKVHLKDTDGDTALGEAAAYNDSAHVKALLDAGAQVNEQNESGQTALMRAAGNNMVSNVRLLLNAGADFNIRDKEGKTIVNYAREANNDAILRLMATYGALEGIAKTEGQDK